MKARLMFTDRDFVVEREPRACEQDLIADLGLETLWEAMAQGDEVVLASSRVAILDGLVAPDVIRYRQAVVRDCLANPGVVREMYGLAVQAVADERKVVHGMFSNEGEALLRRSIAVLELYVTVLKRLRQLAVTSGTAFESEAFSTFFATLRTELDDDYFDEIAEHLRALRFRDGVLVTARLGKLGQGVDYVLRTPLRGHRLLRFLPPSVGRPSFSWTVPPHDGGSGQEIGALRDRVLALVADAVGQSTDHVTSFFQALRRELGFYVGCVNVHERLAAVGEPTTFPDPQPIRGAARQAHGLYDPCLSLRAGQRVEGNDVVADGTPLIIVTGANQGGKSTFLRSVGIAQLMMQAGMFTAAERMSAPVVSAVYTHCKQEEDAGMVHGKFDEELARMRDVTAAMTGSCLLLCNESFAATNEREGSEVASEVIRALVDTGNTVVFVTHLYDLASSFYRHHADTTLFLRADRDSDGSRPFHLKEAEPLPTSYGADLYRATFGRAPGG